MTKIEAYISQFEGEQLHILEYFHSLFTEWGLMPKIRFKVPFYFQHSWIVYLNPVKNEGIELAFLRANELQNPYLDMKDRKQVGGITFYKYSEIKKEVIDLIIQEALLLDESVPYSVKKKNKR